MHASCDLQTVYVSIGEVCVGPLPDLSHDIEGQLCIIDQKTLVIRDFGYDGSGPGKSVNDFYNVQMYEASRSPCSVGGGHMTIVYNIVWRRAHDYSL